MFYVYLKPNIYRLVHTPVNIYVYRLVLNKVMPVGLTMLTTRTHINKTPVPGLRKIIMSDWIG